MSNLCSMEPGDKSHREICIESLPRRPHVVTFDNALSALKLVPGVKGRGAVLDGWTDPIGAHDKRVLEAEEAMFLEKDLVDSLRYCKRVERNWEVAMGVVNEQPHKLEEYVALELEMRTFEKKFARTTSSTEQLELQAQWEKFCAMEPKFKKILAAKKQYELVKNDREQAQEEVLNHGKVMARLRREEKETAERITNDHIHACDQNKSLGEMFPSIRTGYIITRLFGVVDLLFEGVAYEEILEELRVAPRPHTLEFMRYDMRFNRLTLEWETLEEIQRQGKYVRDARDEACGQGDLGRLQVKLDRGEDVDSRDYQGNTGMHVAASISSVSVMSFLVDKGADKEARNKNMETPLVVAAKRGAVESVRWLLSVGGKLNALDTARRTPLMNAILAKSEEMSSLFMDYSVSIRAVDVQWGWTALHCAAHAGMVTVTKSLLAKWASPYAKSKVGQTPLDVARGARQEAVVSLLEAVLKGEPAHEVIAEDGVHIWQGSHKAAHPIWSNNQNFQCVLTIADPRFPDKKLGWLDKGDGGDDDNKELDHLRIEAEVDEDDSTTTSWHRLMCHSRAVVDFLYKAVRKKKKILVHCPLGRNTSVAVLAVYRLLKHGVAIRHTLTAISKKRGTLMNLSGSMATGLQRLQEDFDTERNKRLAQRARMAPILSIAF